MMKAATTLTPEMLDRLAASAGTLAAAQQFAADADRLRANTYLKRSVSMVPIFRN